MWGGITAVWRPLTQMCRWSWPQWLPGAGHSNLHNCQPLLGVKRSPVFVNLYFPYAGQGLLFFCWWQQHFEFQRHVWQWKEEAMLRLIHMHDFNSHFQQDFLAYFIRPVSVHLAMVSVGCSFNSVFNLFAQFKTKTKSHENYVFLYPFSNMAISPPPPPPPPIMKNCILYW